MADDNITISFSDGPTNDGNESAGASSPLGNGVNEKEESQEKLFERLFGDMTDSMSDIFDLLSGGGKGDGGIFSDLKNAAASILGGKKEEPSDIGGGKDKNSSFTKASKVAGLKPEDINIVDQQYILGALLINTTLSKIDDKLTLLLKAGSGGKKAPSAGGGGSGDKGADTKGGALKGFKENVSDFAEINAIAKTLIPLCMANMQAVKWAVVAKFFKNLKKNIENVIEISEILDENKSSIDKFVDRTLKLVGGLIVLSLGFSVIGVFTPLLLLSIVGSVALKIAIKPILEVVDHVAKNKNVEKFQIKANNLMLGMLAMLAAVTLLTLMLPLLPLAILSALLLTVTVLAMRLVLLVMPSAGTIGKGVLSALLLALFFSFMALAVFMVHTVGTDIKKTALNMATIAIVAIGGALIAAILGIPYVLALVALGTVTALCLAIFFTAITYAVKTVAKAGQFTDAAIAALGHISKKSKDGDDGTEKKDATGILGFFSTLASWSFIKALLISILTNSFLALSAIGLYIGAKLIYSAFGILAKMSDDYFPVGVPLKDTAPGAAVIAISHFAKFISGKEDAWGNPIDGEPIIGWGTLLEILPLIAYGLLVKLAAKFLKEGFDELNKLTRKEMIEAGNKAVQLGETLNTIRNGLKPDSSGRGLVSWVLGKILGEDVGDAIDWLTACLPLFSLMLYGWLLEKAAVPIQNGIDAIGLVDPSKVTPAKMNAIGTAISGMMGPIKEFTSGFMDHSDRYGNIVEAICGLVGAFPQIIDVIIRLGNTSMDSLNKGLANFAYLLDQLIGTEDSRNLAEKFGEFFSFGLYDSGKGATKGSLLSALSSIEDNNVKVNSTVFNQVTELMKTITPIADQVIEFTKVTPESLQAGIDGIKTIISSCSEIMGVMDGTNETGGWGALNRVLSIAENNSAAKANENNPLFAIVDLFSKLGDFELFAQNVTKFSGSLKELTTSMGLMNDVDVSGFKNFVDSITSTGLTTGIHAVSELVSYKSDIDALAESFYDLGDAINAIAQIDTSRLTQVIEETNASALAVIKAQREAEANMQGAATASAVDEYTRYIADVLTAWENNGIKLRQNNAPAAVIVPPRVNNATTAGRWE